MGVARPVGEILMEDGTHMVDMIRFLLSAKLTFRGVERFLTPNSESIAITAALGSLPVLLKVGSGRDHLVFDLEVSFSKGRIRIGNGVYEEFVSSKSPHYQGYRSLERTRARRPRVTGYFRNMLADAVACVRDPRREPRSSALDGYQAVRFIRGVLDGLAP